MRQKKKKVTKAPKDSETKVKAELQDKVEAETMDQKISALAAAQTDANESVYTYYTEQTVEGEENKGNEDVGSMTAAAAQVNDDIQR